MNSSNPARIRLATEQDAAQIRDVYAPYVQNTVISFEIEPPTVEEMLLRMRKVQSKHPWLVCDKGGEIIGYAYASEHGARAAYQWSADVAVYINSPFHRCGVGRALYSALFPLLKLQGFFNAYAGVTLPNANSVGLHEAMGFKPVGTYRHVGYKMGAWRDVGWWHLPLREASVKPTPLFSIEWVLRHSNCPQAFEQAEHYIRLPA